MPGTDPCSRDSTLKLIIHAITPMSHRKEKDIINEREPKEEERLKQSHRDGMIKLASMIPGSDNQVSKQDMALDFE
jgi:hypothetical protein